MLWYVVARMVGMDKWANGFLRRGLLTKQTGQVRDKSGTSKSGVVSDRIWETREHAAIGGLDTGLP